MKAEVGDKVRVIEDVRFCDTIKKGDIVEIEYVDTDGIDGPYEFYVKGHEFSNGISPYFLYVEDFELVEKENEK